MSTDPVCGMEVDPSAGKPSVEHHGTIYHFCSEGCKARFTEDPDRYLGATSEDQVMGHVRDKPVSTAHGDHTCPMHPRT